MKKSKLGLLFLSSLALVTGVASTGVAGVFVFKENTSVVKATDAAISLSDGVYSGSGTTGQIVWSSTSSTITQTKGSSSNNVNSSYVSAPRWYQSHVISFAANDGYVITGAIVVCSNTTYATALGNSTYSTGASASVSSSTVTITSTGDFTVTLGAQSRISSIKVQYGSSKTLSSISISGSPTKTVYTEGESFDPAGLVATATFSDSSTSVITNDVEWTIDPDGALSVGVTSVDVIASYSNVLSEVYTVSGLTVNEAPPVGNIESGSRYIIYGTYQVDGETVYVALTPGLFDAGSSASYCVTASSLDEFSYRDGWVFTTTGVKNQYTITNGEYGLKNTDANDGVKSSSEIGQYTLSLDGDEIIFTDSDFSRVSAFYKNGTTYTFRCYTNKFSNTSMCWNIGVKKVEAVGVTVTYDLNGGTMNGDSSVTGLSSDEFTLPAPTKQGYSFNGWYDGDTKVGDAGDVFTTGKSVTLKASWIDVVSQTAVNTVSSYMQLGFSYTPSSQTVPAVASKVTAINQIGSSFVIANESYNVVATSTITSQLLGTSGAVLSGGKAKSLDAGYGVYHLAQIAEGEYGILNESDEYLGCTAVKKMAFSSFDSVDDVTQGYIWNISFDAEGNVVIANKNTSYGKLQYNYNSGSDRFSSYTSTQSPIQIYNLGETTLTERTYNDVQFKVRFGVDSSISSLTSTEGVASGYEYGIYIEDDKTEQTKKTFALSSSSKTSSSKDIEGNAIDITYVVLNVGDCVNNLENASRKFTVKAFVKTDGVVYYGTGKTYSVADLVATYHAAGYSAVDSLYNIYNEAGLYK